MADTTVDSAASVTTANGNSLRWPYWLNTLEWVIVFIDSSLDPSVRYTTNGGTSRTKTVLQAQSARKLAVRFDRETPWDSWDSIHITRLDSAGQICKYVNRDISAATAGTIRSAATWLTVATAEASNILAITKTRNWNLLIAYLTNTQMDVIRSVDSWANRTSRADVFETATEEDLCLLFPANTGDDADACAVYHDISANAISIKMYDDSADTRTETAVVSAVDNTPSTNYDWSIRHSDWHLLVALYNAHDTAWADLLTYDLTIDSIASPTVTSKTNILTNSNDSSWVWMIINQQNDDVYVATLKNGTWWTSESLVFYISTDDMATWWSEQAYSETAKDYRRIHWWRTATNDGWRIQFCMYDDDLDDLFVNLVNDIEIAAPAWGSSYTPRMMMWLWT